MKECSDCFGLGYLEGDLKMGNAGGWVQIVCDRCEGEGQYMDYGNE